MRPADIQGPPCDCPECRQAQVSDKPILRDPDTGKWLHGYPLKRVHDAAANCLQAVKDLAAKKAMR